MSFYCVYEQVADGHGITLEVQKQRHQKLLNGDSEFFNPWQYRIFSPLLVQGTIEGWNYLTSAIGLSHLQSGRTEYIPYLLFRFVQNLFIFFAALLFYQS